MSNFIISIRRAKTSTKKLSSFPPVASNITLAPDIDLLPGASDVSTSSDAAVVKVDMVEDLEGAETLVAAQSFPSSLTLMKKSLIM